MTESKPPLRWLFHFHHQYVTLDTNRIGCGVDEVLGVERAKLFRGGMNVDKFTDDEGRTLTLAELKQLENITL